VNKIKDKEYIIHNNDSNDKVDHTINDNKNKKNNKNNDTIQNETNNISPLYSYNNPLHKKEDNFCVLCFENLLKTYVITPCVHKVSCLKCGNNILSNQKYCPLCNKPLVLVLHKIYFNNILNSLKKYVKRKNENKTLV